MSQQASHLKGEFGRVFLEEDAYEAVDYQVRLEVLVDMLRRRGQEVSQSAQRLFSGPPTGTAES